jgi:rhodanese-related sulfurtransferase
MASDFDKEVVGAEEARELIAGEGALAVDLRDEDAWDSGHIPGAVRSSPEDLESKADDLPEDQVIIVACEDGKQSAEVAERLRSNGCKAASIKGGMKEWDNKLPEQPRPDEEFEGPDYSKPPGV